MLRACGIDALHHPLTSTDVALTATLKNEAEDFVVVELDQRGQRTDAQDYVFDEPSPKPTTTSSSQKEDDVVATHAGVCVEMSTVLNQLVSSAVALRQCFGTRHDISRRAEELSCTEQSALVQALQHEARGASSSANVPSSDDGTNVAWWAATTFVLPQHYNKDGRRLLHLALRELHPHLCSFASSESAGDGMMEVRLRINAHHLLFCSLFGVETADVLAAWSAEYARARARLKDEEQQQLEDLHKKTQHGEKKNVDDDDDDVAYSQVVTSALRTRHHVANFHEMDELSNDDAKEVRRTLHELLRRFFPYIQCRVADGRATFRCAAPRVAQRRKRDDENDDDGDAVKDASSPSSSSSLTTHKEVEQGSGIYTYMIVRKRMLDTMELKLLVAQHFGLRDGCVCIAGMKDKRGITYQRLSVPGHPDEIRSKCAATLGSSPPFMLRWPSDGQQSYVSILHIHPRPCVRPVELGELSGNAFVLRLRDVHPVGATTTTSTTTTSSSSSSSAAEMEAWLQHRMELIRMRGAINYFGQQRFSESVVDANDHTGVHLFAGRYSAAVRSLFRACPDVYDGFPERMDVRCAPANARDAQTMTRALQQMYRTRFSSRGLQRDDVLHDSPAWQRLCEMAITTAMPYALRSMWVHAAQSLFFNLAATEVMRLAQNNNNNNNNHVNDEAVLPTHLPLGGYALGATETETASSSAALQRAAVDAALAQMGLTAAHMSNTRKVAGVPVPGSMRQLLVFPTNTSLRVLPSSSSSSTSSSESVPHVDVEISFDLPSSSYATVVLRELLGNEERW